MSNDNLCMINWRSCKNCLIEYFVFEPRREKTGFLHMRKQRRRLALR